MKQTIISFFYLALLPFNLYAISDITDILESKEQPAGVVIEITSGDALYLKEIMPELTKDIKSLQARFKDLPIAIVSHARESLILASKSSKKHQDLHNQVQSLTKDTNTTVHVCGTYASWFNIDEDGFPDYINVSPAGPVQVDDYLELGYIHVEL